VSVLAHICTYQNEFVVDCTHREKERDRVCIYMCVNVRACVTMYEPQYRDRDRHNEQERHTETERQPHLHAFTICQCVCKCAYVCAFVCVGMCACQCGCAGA